MMACSRQFYCEQAAKAHWDDLGAGGLSDTFEPDIGLIESRGYFDHVSFPFNSSYVGTKNEITYAACSIIMGQIAFSTEWLFLVMDTPT